MIVIKCNKCGERQIVDERDLEEGFSLFCCPTIDYIKIPVSDYKRDEVISMVEGELENWNHHTLYESIARILTPIRNVKTLIKVCNNLIWELYKVKLIED